MTHDYTDSLYSSEAILYSLKVIYISNWKKDTFDIIKTIC